MNTKRAHTISRKLLLILALSILLSACGRVGSSPMQPAPATQVPNADEVRVEAIDIRILESFPVQVNVVVRGQLPDACSFIEKVDQSREGNTIRVTLTVARRPNQRCALMLTPFEHTLALDVLRLPAGTYTVTVHGMSDTFALAVPNIPLEPGYIGGRVWHDLCAVAGGEGGALASPSSGCVPDASGGYRANGVQEPDEPGIPGVLVSLGKGGCPAGGLATATTDDNGRYSFTDLDAGTYCVSVDPQPEPNVSILIPGGWTFPGPEEGSATVTLGAGTQRTDVDFGWDYQFLPEPSPGTGSTPKNIFATILGPTPAPAGWSVRPCEGDAPFLCVLANEEFIGSIELLTFPLDTLPDFQAALAEAGLSPDAIDFQNSEHAAGVLTALKRLADNYYATFQVDRQATYPSDVTFSPLTPEEIRVGSLPGLAYGFAGLHPDGRAYERWLTYTAFDGQTLYSLTAFYDPRAEITFRSDEDLRLFEPFLREIIAGLRLPASVSLIDDLRAAGATVEPAGQVSQPFFSVTGQVITVNGESVQVFEYADAAAADAEAARVSPDGSSVGTTMVTWVATPHFYKKGTLIVLYVGDKATVIEALETVLDPQFAGGSVTSTGPGDPPVVQSAREALARQLNIPDVTRIIVRFEPVEWPDACLGVAIAGRMCAQVLTPGYRVVLEVNGERYEYHTDEAGANIQLAAAPTPAIEDLAIAWQQAAEGGCQQALIGPEAVAFGVCSGPLMAGKFVGDERVADLDDFVKTYQSFQAETPAGSVTFTGQGETVATEAEQRMIAEWARLVAQEAAFGRSGASWGLAFAWHREGGIAGFCDDLSVYVTGDVYATACGGEQPVELGRGRLTPEQLQQVYTWVDSLQGFELDQTDPATADAMMIRVVFSGAGTTEVTDADKQAIQDFAATLFEEFRR